MSKTTEQFDVYVCDAPNCHVERHVPKGEEWQPEGFHGTVVQIAEWGGTASVEWFACSDRHIRVAVTEALRYWRETMG